MHDRLHSYASVPYIRRIGSVLRKVERELARVESQFEIEVISDPGISRFTQLFRFALRYDPNQWLVLRGHAVGYVFFLELPFRNGISLPYTLTIGLKNPTLQRAELHPWLTSHGLWFSEPPNPGRSSALRRLKLPDVAWTHVAGGVRTTIPRGGILVPGEPARWIVMSGYQGLLLNVGPRVVKYLRAADRLDALLALWQITGPAG